MKKLILIYILIISFFGGLYYLSWERNLDTFIVNARLNKAVIDYDFGERDTSEIVESALLYEKIENINRMYAKTFFLEDSIKEELEKVSDSISVLSEKFRKNRMEKIDSMKALKIDSLNVFYSKLLSDSIKCAEYSKSPMQYTEKILCDLKIDSILIKKGKDSLNLVYEYADVYLNTFKYADSGLHNRIYDLQKKRNVLYDSYFAVFYKRGDLNTDFSVVVSKIRKLYEKINFWDFLFYSIGIATTTTFGDVIAVSFAMRALACVELLICVIVLGIFLNKLYDTIKKK